MKLSIAVMAHPKRQKNAEALRKKLEKMRGWSEVSVSYDHNDNEWLNGEASWRLYDKSADWHVVIQDDAIISDNFYKNCESLAENAPFHTVISLYTGTVRPYRPFVTNYVDRAHKRGDSFLKTRKVLWGVGLMMPTDIIDNVLEFCEGRDELYDTRIGRYFESKNEPTLLCNPSIVDHDYTMETLTGHYVDEPRKAHYYEPDVVQWNKRVLMTTLI